MKIQFAILNYYPSFLSEQCITVGIAFHNLSNNERFFYITKNKKRIEQFDDELNIDFFNSNLLGIKKQVEDVTQNYLSGGFDLEKYTNRYVNEYRFERIRTMKAESYEHFTKIMNDTIKLYLKQDFEKSKRLTIKQEKAYVREFLKSNDFSYNSKPIESNFENDKIQFDYIINDIGNNLNYGIKFFKFEGKDINRMISSAKTWAFNANNVDENIRTIIIYDKSFYNDEKYKLAEDILKKNSYKYLSVTESIDYLMTIKNGGNNMIEYK